MTADFLVVVLVCLFSFLSLSLSEYIVYLYSIQIYIRVFFFSLLLEQNLNACEIVKNKYVTFGVCTRYFLAFFRRLFFARKQK